MPSNVSGLTQSILLLTRLNLVVAMVQSSCCLLIDDPSGILNLGKPFIQGFFKPYKFSKGWEQASSSYIQHIYSYSTLSNYPKAQHGQGNKFANAIGTHQRSLCNCSGNDATSGDCADSWLEQVLIDLIH